MKKLLSLLLCTAMLLSLCACGGTANAPKSTEQLYEAFLAGTEPVYGDKYDNIFYTADGGEPQVFEDGTGYTLDQMLERMAYVFSENWETGMWVDKAFYAMLDCGLDGEPELALKVLSNNSMSWGVVQYEFVIKPEDGKLQIRYGDDCYMWNNSDIYTESGRTGEFTDFGYTADTSSFGYLDKDCVHHTIYDMTACVPEEDGTTYIPELSETASQYAGALFDTGWIYEYRFGDPDPDAEEDLRDACISYGAYFEEDMEVWESMLNESGVIWYTEEEIDAIIDKMIDQAGLADDPEENPEWILVRENVGRAPRTQIRVCDAAGLLASVADDTEILLAPGVYNITKYLENRSLPVIDTDAAYAYEAGLYDHYWEPLVVNGYSHLRIASEDPASPAQIVCEPRDEVVMTFVNCPELELADVIMGHTPEQGECSGDVLSMYDCAEARITGCDLYGCGAYGMNLQSCSDLTVRGTVIHDCTWGMINAISCSQGTFTDCTFRDCDGYTMFAADYSTLTFEDCSFSGLGENLLRSSEYHNIFFDGCTFDEAALEDLKSNEYFDEYVFIRE